MPLLGRGELLVRQLFLTGRFLLGPEQCLLGKGVVAGNDVGKMNLFFFSFYVMIHRSFVVVVPQCR